MSAGFKRSLSSLQVPNYRRYFTGQVVSLSGNWMQMVAEMWLIVKLTGSGVSVGLTAAFQFLPIMLLGAWAGVLADRFDKRKLLMLTQSLMILPAVGLFLATVTGAVEVWMVYLTVLLRGTVLAFDNPARQSFVMEMVGGERVVNAVSLNSVIVHVARIAGPAVAGGAIALFGVGLCFLLNALTFVVMLIALQRMDAAQLFTRGRSGERRPGQIRAALREVRARPELRIPLGMMVVAGLLSFNFLVVLPLFAEFTWHGTAGTYSLLVGAMGVGSVIGALISGAHGRVSPTLLVGSAAAFGVASLAAALAPTLELQVAALIPLGGASVTFAAGVNSSLQLAAGDAMRGRVMALYSVVFLGTTPIGSPIIGWVAEVAGPRWSLGVGAVAALAAALGGWWAYRRIGTTMQFRPSVHTARRTAASP